VRQGIDPYDPKPRRARALPGGLPRQARQDPGRAVGRAIVDDDHLEIGIPLFQQSPHGRFDPRRLVARGDDHRQARNARAGGVGLPVQKLGERTNLAERGEDGGRHDDPEQRKQNAGRGEQHGRKRHEAAGIAITADRAMSS